MENPCWRCGGEMYGDVKQHRRVCRKVERRNPHFCLLDEMIFGNVLTFLGNQTLTKLQMITGDSYANCYPKLAALCCPCENDNPSVFYGICRHCESKRPVYMPNTTEDVARKVYGVTDLQQVSRGRDQNLRPPCELKGGSQDVVYYEETFVIARFELENYMLEECGSKLGWLYRISQLSSKKRKRAIKGLQDRPQRYGILKAALEARGLKVRSDSTLCQNFIKVARGDLERVVDTMEEMQFLYQNTSYLLQYEQSIDSIQYLCGGQWQSPDRYREECRTCRGNIKMYLCVDYLKDAKGHTLPLKWEKCRSRAEEVIAHEVGLREKARYIYMEIGRPYLHREKI